MLIKLGKGCFFINVVWKKKKKKENSGGQSLNQRKTSKRNTFVTIDTPPTPAKTLPTHEGPEPNNGPGSKERENNSNGEKKEKEILP